MLSYDVAATRVPVCVLWAVPYEKKHRECKIYRYLSVHVEYFVEIWKMEHLHSIN